MTSPFDRFTERARKVLSLAQEEAEALNHRYIGTEHILLGLIREGEGTAAQVLGDLGVELARVRKAVEYIVGRSERTVSRERELTAQAKKALEHAVDAARKMGHSYIGTEHLLLGMLRGRDNVANSILENVGASPDRVRSRLTQMLHEVPTPVAASPQRQQSKTPYIDALGLDLTEAARAGRLDPVIGRETEIERMIQILSRRTKNNPALIGDPGVGKSAIVEGLAQRIVRGVVPEPLLNKRVLALDMGAVVAGTKYRGQFEERLKKVVDEIRETHSILFIDEFHTIIGAGGAEGSLDAANILKPALSRGQIQCIGATTLDDFRKYIERDAALERRFQPVFVEEPSVEETIQILRGIASRYEDYHQCRFSDEALIAAAHLAARYISDRHLPDKAIDLIDEAAARVRMYRHHAASPIRQILDDLEEVRQRKEAAIAQQSYEQAIALREEENALRLQMEEMREGQQDATRPTITADDIAEVAAMWTGIPMTRLAEEESARLMCMEEELHKRIVGQNEAIELVSKSIRRARAGLKDPRRPIGSLIFLGPTGVGKSELAKALAEFLFGTEDALIKIDMSEFMERHTSARLVGAPPGYVGYGEGGQLTDAVRNRPYCVVLLDEIEKAHPDVFNMLLQLMEDGCLTDAKGRKVDFRNAVIVMTSNVAAEKIIRGSAWGFSSHGDKQAAELREYEAMKDKVLAELQNLFRPEFLNRVDAIVVFHALLPEHIREIARLQLQLVEERLREAGFEVEITSAAVDLLAQRGFDSAFGARPLKRVITNMVEDPLAEAVLRGRFHLGDTIVVDAAEEQIVFNKAGEPSLVPPEESGVTLQEVGTN
jgi:ATP-dependent Clp protease ATP-binding subunit ClpC